MGLRLYVHHLQHQDKSTSDGSSRPPPVVSRLHMSEQQEKDKLSYEAKERQAALRKNKEKKLADLKVNSNKNIFDLVSTLLKY